jgi:hypothetical protein
MQIQDAAKRFSWIKVGDDGIAEFYCDHSMLSALRMCESYFQLQYLSHPGKRFSLSERNWNLDFGSWVHATLELFYFYEYKKLRTLVSNDPTCFNCNHPRSWHSASPIGCRGYNLRPSSKLPEWAYSSTTDLKVSCSCNKFVAWDYIPKGTFIAHGSKLWTKMQMDQYEHNPNFKKLGGEIGALALLSDYYAVYGGGKERLRVVGIELPFGLGKEVPIIDVDCFSNSNLEKHFSWLLNQKHMLRAYLTGRIDMLFDDLISLALMDHKSTAFFDGSESTKFTPHDGMLGYVYAGNCLVNKLKAKGVMSRDKNCNRMIVNHICLQQKDKNDKLNNAIILRPEMRFTRSPLTFAPEQLLEFRVRQAATFNALYELVINERPAQWNTGSCNNFYHKDCVYKPIHSLTPSARDTIIKAQYKVLEEWTPFHESKTEII